MPKQDLSHLSPAQLIERKLRQRISTAQNDLYNFQRFSAVVSKTCWASTSNKPVWFCSCPQCREIVLEIESNDDLPEWLKDDLDTE